MAGDAAGGVDRTYATVYSSSFLSIFYDYYVLGFNMKYIWGCPADKILLPFFSENLSRKHLDIGVATGYFPAVALARPFRRDTKQELTLLDLNPNPLRATTARVLSVTTKTEVRSVEADVTEPLPRSCATPSSTPSPRSTSSTACRAARRSSAPWQPSRR